MTQRSVSTEEKVVPCSGTREKGNQCEDIFLQDFDKFVAMAASQDVGQIILTTSEPADVIRAALRGGSAQIIELKSLLLQQVS